VIEFALNLDSLETLYNNGGILKYLGAVAYKMYHLKKNKFYTTHRRQVSKELELLVNYDYPQEETHTPEQKINEIIEELPRVEKLWLKSYLKCYSNASKLSDETGIDIKSVRERMKSIYKYVRDTENKHHSRNGGNDLAGLPAGLPSN
jgi:hypothetical protein